MTSLAIRRYRDPVMSAAELASRAQRAQVAALPGELPEDGVDGGSVSRVGSMCEAIAEAVFLDHVFRRGEPTAAVDAVFRELAWQRRHLRALRAAG